MFYVFDGLTTNVAIKTVVTTHFVLCLTSNLFLLHCVAGVSDLEELLVVASHPLRLAVQRHPPPEEDLGGSVTVGFQPLVKSSGVLVYSCIYA